MASASAAHAQPVPTRAGGIAAPGATPAWSIGADGTTQFKTLGGNASGANVMVNGVLGQVEGVLEGMVSKTAQAQSSANAVTTLLNAPLVIGTLPALSAGTSAIGTVGVTALPALPAGSAHVGAVAVDALPALPAGAAHVGSVTLDTALPAGAAHTGSVTIDTALPVGAAHVGSVAVDAMPALPAGAAHVGSVAIDGTVTTADPSNASIYTWPVITPGAVPAGTRLFGYTCSAATTVVLLDANGAAITNLLPAGAFHSYMTEVPASFSVTGTNSCTFNAER